MQLHRNACCANVHALSPTVNCKFRSALFYLAYFLPKAKVSLSFTFQFGSVPSYLYCECACRSKIRCCQDNSCHAWHRPEARTWHLSSYLHVISSVNGYCCTAGWSFLFILSCSTSFFMRRCKKELFDDHWYLCNLNEHDIIALTPFWRKLKGCITLSMMRVICGYICFVFFLWVQHWDVGYMQGQVIHMKIRYFLLHILSMPLNTLQLSQYCTRLVNRVYHTE